MDILGDVLRELFGMFLADLKLSLSILALVGAVATLVEGWGVIPPLAGGAILLVGCLVILVGVAVAGARRT